MGGMQKGAPLSVPIDSLYFNRTSSLLNVHLYGLARHVFTNLNATREPSPFWTMWGALLLLL